MNKLWINAIALVGASIPITALTSCNLFKPSNNIVFYVSNISMNYFRKASFFLTWSPIEDVLDFSNFKFKYNNDQKEASVNVNSDGKNKLLIINLLFNEDITNDITDGKLFFHCKDNTTGIEFDKTIEPIKLIMPSVIMLENSDGITLTNGKWILAD